MKSREHVVTNGRAAFYACMLGDFRKAALNCGWAIGIHGSLNADMDLMAMPWTEDSKPVEEFIKALSNCFDKPISEKHDLKPFVRKPNGRVVYTLHIWADFYIDISIIRI